MPKLPPQKPREVISKLKSLGFVLDHVSGSHHIMYHPQTKKRIPIPFHNKDLKTGTLRAIIRQIDLSVEEFLKIK